MFCNDFKLGIYNKVFPKTLLVYVKITVFTSIASSRINTCAVI